MSSSTHDLEMGPLEPIAKKINVSENKQDTKSSGCYYGRIVTDLSLYPASVVAFSAGAGVAYTYIKTEYVAAAIFSFLLILQLVVVGRLYCLGKLKSFAKQNKLLAQELNKLEQEKNEFLNEKKQFEMDIVNLKKEKSQLQIAEKNIENTLAEKINEIDLLNKSLHETEAKLEQLTPLYNNFKEIEAQLSHEIDQMKKGENTLSKDNKNFVKEKDEFEKTDQTIKSDVKDIDLQNSKFQTELQKLEELVSLIKKEIQMLGNLYEKVKNEEANLNNLNKKAANDAEKLKIAQERLQTLTQRFVQMIDEFKKLSPKIPELDALIKKMDLSNV